MDWSYIPYEFDDIYVFTGEKTDEASCQRDRIPSGKFDGDGEHFLLHEIGLSNQLIQLDKRKGKNYNVRISVIISIYRR